MTQKIFDHFFKLDNSSSGLHSPDPGSAKVVPQVIVEKSLNKFTSDFNAEELKGITEALLDQIRGMVSESKFNAYFANTFTVSAILNNTVEIVVNTAFIKQMIETQYVDTIQQSLHQLLDKTYDIKIQVLGQTQSLSSNNDNILNSLRKKPEPSKPNTFMIQDLNPTKEDLIKAIDAKVMEHEAPQALGNIDTHKTFDNFVPGANNNMARAFAWNVAENPGKVYQALYIYGNSGLGKTHLIHAIANHVLSKNPGTKISLTSAGSFFDEMVKFIGDNKLPEFRQKYVTNDILIIDDVHMLKNKNLNQEQLFQIFNALMEKGKQLIFTSDKPPKEIDGIEDRLRTRLSNALLVEIQQPDLETRIAILKKKAIERDVYLGDDVVTLIAKCVKSNIRELEGCLIKLGAVTSLLKIDIDLEVAKEHLKLDEELENQKNLTIESISKCVASYYKILIGDLRGKNRSKEVAVARQVAMYLISRHLKPTLAQIGIYFTNRDHSTVLHAVNTVSEKVKANDPIAQDILEIEKMF